MGVDAGWLVREGLAPYAEDWDVRRPKTGSCKEEAAEVALKTYMPEYPCFTYDVTL